MDDERENLHNWESQNIFVKTKEHGISQYVSETILTLRWYLVNEMITQMRNSLQQTPAENHLDIVAEVMDYSRLAHNFSERLGRVMSRF